MRPRLYKFNVIKALQDLASYKFQQLAWFPNDQGVMSSFNEDVMALYDDTGLDEYLLKEAVFDAATDQLLKDLFEMTMAIPDDVDERELIDSPEMEAVRQKAAEALALVQASDGSESAVEIIE